MASMTYLKYAKTTIVLYAIYVYCTCAANDASDKYDQAGGEGMAKPERGEREAACRLIGIMSGIKQSKQSNWLCCVMRPLFSLRLVVSCRFGVTVFRSQAAISTMSLF